MYKVYISNYKGGKLFSFNFKGEKYSIFEQWAVEKVVINTIRLLESLNKKQQKDYYKYVSIGTKLKRSFLEVEKDVEFINI